MPFCFWKSNTYAPQGFDYSAVRQLHDAVVKRQISFQNVVGGVSNVITLLTSVLLKPQLESCLQLWAQHFQKDLETAESRVMRTAGGIEYMRLEISDNYFFSSKKKKELLKLWQKFAQDLRFLVGFIMAV